MQDGAGAGDLLQDVAGLCGPDKGLGILVVAVDIVTDGHDELFEVVEHAASDSFLGQITKEALDHVQP